MKPEINLFQKWTAIERFPYHFLSYNRVNINIIPSGEKYEIFIFEAFKIKSNLYR